MTTKSRTLLNSCTVRHDKGRAAENQQFATTSKHTIFVHSASLLDWKNVRVQIFFMRNKDCKSFLIFTDKETLQQQI